MQLAPFSKSIIIPALVMCYQPHEETALACCPGFPNALPGLKIIEPWGKNLHRSMELYIDQIRRNVTHVYPAHLAAAPL